MPHVVVKLWPGKSEDQKARLTRALLDEVTTILGYGDESVSIAFEEVSPADWSTMVYGPDIQENWASLAKAPGYGPGPQG